MPDEKPKPTRTRATKTQKAAPKSTRARKPKATIAPEEAIAFHAYLLWERGEPGDATQHWLRAERELLAA